jgi:uncharacterized cupin superfamily protein
MSERIAKRIDLSAVPVTTGSGYPAPFDAACAQRQRQRLGDTAGLTDIGVNSQRHWHTAEDEFTYVLEGELVLVTDSGEEILKAGDCVGFKAGVADGHHFQNRSTRDAIILDIGSRKTNDACHYPDIDLHSPQELDGYAHKDGTPYAAK